MKMSISRIKLFKACRRAFYFKYIEGLRPVEKPEALETGSNYHELIEWLNKKDSFDGVEEDYSKEQAMASAYAKYIYPKVKIVEAEKKIEMQINGVDYIGIVDGVTSDGCIVEHKTTSRDISEGGEYEYNLLWDEQILMYMLLTGARKIYYTLCRKPTIRQKKDETEEEFYKRMIEWYDVDTDSKIRFVEITRTDEEVEAFKKELDSIALEINVAGNQNKNAVSAITDPYYRNTCHCNSWGRRCEYSSICLNYNPDADYIEFTKGEN